MTQLPNSILCRCVKNFFKTPAMLKLPHGNNKQEIEIASVGDKIAHPLR